LPRRSSDISTGAADVAAERAFAAEAAQLLADRRCEDIRVLDVRGLSHVCDFQIIASGTSERQMKSVAAEVKDLGEERGMAVFRSTSDVSHTWVVIDCVDVVVHLFEPNLRLYYDLEDLWSETEAIDWRRDDQKAHHRYEGEIGLPAEDDEDA